VYVEAYHFGHRRPAAGQSPQQEKTNLNAVFCGWLERYTTRDGAGERYDRLMKSLGHVSSGRKFTREKMNER